MSILYPFLKCNANFQIFGQTFFPIFFLSENDLIFLFFYILLLSKKKEDFLWLYMGIE